MADPAAFASVWQAYFVCRRRKRGTANTQRYEMRLLERIVDTATALRTKTWKPSRSVCFVATQPKAREIHAADFADRVVHHVLVPRLESIYEPLFIHDLYSNRKGKGTHAAVERLAFFMRSLGDRVRGPVFFLQLDVANFFNSIDRVILLQFLKKRITDAAANGGMPRWRDLLWLCRSLLESAPAANVIRRGSPASFSRVPAHKRLANAPPGKGLPIGNLTSQFFANVYLNELDQFVKHTLRCRHYLRYVDDMVLLHEDQEQLLAWRHAISLFLAERLDLCLKNSEARPRPVTDGADFLGYIVRPHYRLVRRRVVGNMRQRLNDFERRWLRCGGLLLATMARERLRATMASYCGHFRHADSYRLLESIFVEFPWLSVIFGRRDGGLWPLWEPRSVCSLRGQWRYFSSRFESCAILTRVGNRVELYNGDAVSLLRRLPWIARMKGMKTRPRPGFEATLSFPARDGLRFGRYLRKRMIPFVYVAEEGWLRGGIKRRVLRYLFSPGGADSPSPGAAHHPLPHGEGMSGCAPAYPRPLGEGGRRPGEGKSLGKLDPRQKHSGMTVINIRG